MGYLCVLIELFMGRLELSIETDHVSIYSPKYDGESMNEFDKFLMSNNSHAEPQLKVFFDAIISAIEKIEECGARENLFRPEGGRVKAIPLMVNVGRIDKSIGKIRLYCLRYSDQVLIIGNGGVSLAGRYEDDPNHLAFVNDLRQIDQHIRRIARQADTDFNDTVALKMIIESISL